jgi:scyllo-inositol 2-dehydrogenase (NADP+)
LVRVALLGLGKRGLSHQAIINAHPDVELVAVCDTTEYLLDILTKYTSVKTYTNYRKLLATEKLDAVFIATPSRIHAEMVRTALKANLHVFCEKPFSLDVAEGRELADLAEAKKRVNQVGYHYRFVGVFHEMKRLLSVNALGKLHHIRAEAYGPVVLRPKGITWGTSKIEGGGCLYDYACHAIDLVHYLVGRPDAVSGTILNRLFSRNVEDEVYTSMTYADGMTGQIAANWSDESYHKMSMKVTVWGASGKMVGDRQELQIYLCDDASSEGLKRGWNTRYTTDLTEEVWFYLRGEEYSAQVDHFIQAIETGKTDTRSTFRTAADADVMALAMIKDATSKRTPTSLEGVVAEKPTAPSFWGSIRRLDARKATASS